VGSGSGSTSAGLSCFAPGTLIQTENGEVPVESLVIGTKIMTTNGPKPVKWIGRQTLKRNKSAAWHPRVLPVRVARFAIDDVTPHRDVCLSQWHSLFIDGVLVPARHLVNGRSIRFDETALSSETLEYFHVELETHEVIFADGMPVESYMYAGGIVAWDNTDEYQQRYGAHRIMSPFAPVHSYNGGFDELGGLIRLVASRIVDVRDPIQVAHDRLKRRALQRAA
jgi:Hint domain